jgi:hypothetical protein
MGEDRQGSAEIAGIVIDRIFVINGLICCLKRNTAREWLASGVLASVVGGGLALRYLT